MLSDSRRDLFAYDYVNEDHVRAFEAALNSEETEMEPDASPVTAKSSRFRIRKVAALSDFAPINVTLPRRAKITRKRQDCMFHIIRWPLLALLFTYIYGIFGLYILVRQIVNAIEWTFAWRGERGILRQRMRAAKSYAEWKEAAITMDNFLGFDEWKKEDRDPYYDWALVRKVRRSLHSLRQKDDARGVLGVLETCIKANFAGTESSRLYSEVLKGPKYTWFHLTNRLQTHYGTKECIEGIADNGWIDHVGVTRALLDAELLPRVVAGTSAGGLVAALVCTRSDDELKQLLVPGLADMITACEEPFSVWIPRFFRTGARFDTVQWARKASFFTRGSLTFREAYQLTGRVLNISVIPFDRHSPTRLLNYLTAPNCVIWSALLASAAVPGILNPVVLMQKDKSGRLLPWNWGSRFRDGSLRVDIPIQSLNLLFNVNNPVVSQVNPHVHLWHFGPKGTVGKPVAHRKGKGWRGGFILSAAEQWLKLELTKNFKFMRDLELLPTLLGQDWSSVFLQRFDGAVTIWPRTKISHWFRILSDPTREELQEMILVGQRVTWPKLHIIENRFKLEREIIRGRQSVRQPRQRDRFISNAEPSVVPSKEETSLASLVNDLPSSEELAIDSDAEASFEKGSPRFFKQRKQSSTNRGDPTKAQVKISNDPLVSSNNRQRWAAALLDSGVSEIPETGTTEGPRTAVQDSPSPPTSPEPNTARSPTLFSRFRKGSLAAFPRAFNNFGLKQSNVQPQIRDGEPWSSDSSSSDYPPDECDLRYRPGSSIPESTGTVPT
ncbi:hypothetical protein Clacol_001657 [Clathrus columnatus]|uniref:Patatin-like phospholipase domain-containing protein n=1 Tax=Clathrus columnatus TaxID=1419009 RepID=A0AAV4ZZS0_9AGAM|nr:hypothetical protein Clacol_001657 [Clathrus columnatus]